MRKIVFLLAVIFCLSYLTACGGGGGNGASGVTTAVSGVASKGLINGGTVNVYAITGGAKGALLATGTTNSSGAYSISIGSYTGPVWIEVTGGTYKDEATGTVIVPLSIPLRAFVPDASGSVSVAVTPFTEIAAQNAVASGSLTAEQITQSNQLISNNYQLTDIINTMPVDASSMAAGTATGAPLAYGQALAGVSQLMASGQSLNTVISNLGTLSSTNINDFKSAVSTFLGSGYNKTPDKNINGTPFVNAGTDLQPSKTTASADGSESIEMTATFSSNVAEGTPVTFTITSGSAKFSNNQITYTVNTSSHSASASLTSTQGGNVVVTASIASGPSAQATVSFVSPSISLQASKNYAFADAGTKVTLTATVTPASSAQNVTFTVTSGTAAFSNGSQSISAPLSSGTASAEIASSSPGNVVVTADYPYATSSTANVTFANPAKAVVKVGLKQAVSKLTILAFDIVNTPAGSVSIANSNVVPINEALSVSNIGFFETVNSSTTRVNLFDNTPTTGFDTVANSLIVQFIYTITSGMPEFSVSTTGVNYNLYLYDPTNPSVNIKSQLNPEDFVVTVTYQDSSGHDL